MFIKYIIIYQDFQKQTFFFPRVNNLYGYKSLSYLGCKLWEELPRNLNDQSYLGEFQYGLKDNLLKGNQKKIKQKNYIPLVKLTSLYWCLYLTFWADCCWSHILGVSRAVFVLAGFIIITILFLLYKILEFCFILFDIVTNN